MYTGFFEQVKRPGGAVADGGENLKKGLDPEAQQGGVRGKDAPRLYTGIFEQVWRSGGPVASGAGASEKGIENSSSETRRSWLGRDQRPGDLRFGTVAAVPEEPFATTEKGSVGVRVHGHQHQRFGRKPAGQRKCRADGREASSAVRSEAAALGEKGKPAKHSCTVVLEEITTVRGRQPRNSSGSLTS